MSMRETRKIVVATTIMSIIQVPAMLLRNSKEKWKAMRQKELREKVALLKDGQIVEIAGDYFRAIQLLTVESQPACMQCDLDSICHDDVLDVCTEMESMGSRHWILKLAHPL